MSAHNLYVTGGDYVGESTLSGDPLLADWPNGDMHLLPGSPCVDAGLNDVLPPDLTTDFYGEARVFGGAVDIGATESSAPALSFSVRTATVKWYRGGQGRLALWADLDVPTPNPTDVLALDFDGTRLFSAPFSAFRRGLLPGVYNYTDRGLVIRLDLRAHRVFLQTPKMAMPGMDKPDDVNIRFQVGQATGEESIAMRVLLRGQWWVYVRPGLLEPPPEVD